MPLVLLQCLGRRTFPSHSDCPHRRLCSALQRPRARCRWLRLHLLCPAVPPHERSDACGAPVVHADRQRAHHSSRQGRTSAQIAGRSIMLCVSSLSDVHMLIEKFNRSRRSGFLSSPISGNMGWVSSLSRHYCSISRPSMSLMSN